MNPLRNNSIYPIDNNNHFLQNLFSEAILGNWEYVYHEVINDPALLEKEWEGNTLAVLAALQFSENPMQATQAASFLKNITEAHLTFDVDATLKNAPYQGATVLWLLAKGLFANSGELTIGYESECLTYIAHLLGFSDPENLSAQSLISFNINAAPENGTFQGVTLFSLFLGLFPKETLLLLTPDLEITDSASPPLDIERQRKCHISLILLDRILMKASALKTIPMTEKDRSDMETSITLLLHHLFNIIEKNISCDINIEIPSNYQSAVWCDGTHNILEWVLATSFTPERQKLLIFLILSGAKPTVLAKKEWVEEYQSICNKFKVIEKTILVLSEPFASQTGFVLDIQKQIALKMFWTTFPELENYPSGPLIKLWKKFCVSLTNLG